MNQQINLYLPEFRVRKEPLTAVLMAQVVAAVVVILVLLSAFDFYRQWQLTQELVTLRAELEEATARTDALNEQLTRRSRNEGLQNRLAAAESRLESSRQIRTFLSRTQLGNVDGFSEHLKDLSRARVEGLSISGFSINEGGSRVEVAGEVTTSALVPRYVANLESSTSTLKNLRFSPSISRPGPQDQFFQFRLNTENE